MHGKWKTRLEKRKKKSGQKNKRSMQVSSGATSPGGKLDGKEAGLMVETNSRAVCCKR